SWLEPAVRLASTPLLPLLCHFDTMPSSSSSFRTSLLVYHLLPLSPNICHGSAKIRRIIHCLNDEGPVGGFETTQGTLFCEITSRLNDEGPVGGFETKANRLGKQAS